MASADRRDRITYNGEIYNYSELKRFRGAEDFGTQLDAFLARLDRGEFRPRGYIVENLNLEDCARRFVEFLDLPKRTRDVP